MNNENNNIQSYSTTRKVSSLAFYAEESFLHQVQIFFDQKRDKNLEERKKAPLNQLTKYSVERNQVNSTHP